MNMPRRSPVHNAFRASILRLLIARLIAALVATAPAGAQARPLYHWLQYVPGGLEARAITRESACPTALVNDSLAPMTPRGEPGEAFPIRVCAVPVPADAHDISIDGVPLPSPKPRYDRILLLGDTGCRLKGAKAQDCNDISSWPFRLVADVAADLKPDLVLHLGDYLYRETACPPMRKGCAGSPAGDAWDAWEADFFQPAAALLDSTPFVFVRGNHEVCARSGAGWSRLLDPFPLSADKTCPGQARPYFVDLGGVTLLVFDVSEANEFKADPKQADWFRQQFSAAQFAGPGPVWLAFHRPIWAPASFSADEEPGDNKTLALAAQNNIPANVEAILSGHEHTFQVLSYDDDLPAQIVVGNGGDSLLGHAPQIFDGAVVNGVRIRKGLGVPGQFGFAMLERHDLEHHDLEHNDLEHNAQEWSLTDYDTHGGVRMVCHLKRRSLDCN